MDNFEKNIEEAGCECCASNISIINKDNKTSCNIRKEETGKKRIYSIGIIASAIVLFILSISLPNLSKTAVLLLSLSSWIIAGSRVLLSAGKNILKGKIFDENFLMGIATIGAFAIGESPEGAAVMIFYRIGGFFEDMAINRSKKSISSLMDLSPGYAVIKTEDGFAKIPPENVRVNDILVIKPGEKVPVDSEIISGSSSADTSAITGESAPRDITGGDIILSGFINMNGLLTVKAIREYHDSTVARILNMVQNASSRKSATENFISKFARYYTPFVVFSAAAMAIIPSLFDGNWSIWVHRALVFLVVSCPCALVVSIPLSFFGGIGGASRNGILVKGGNFLEALNKVDTVVFDKTGTLTKGVLKVAEIKCGRNYTNEQVIEFAAYAESFSNHPIALSILKEYGKIPDQSYISGYEELPGYGIKADIHEHRLVVGNSRLLSGEGIAFPVANSMGTIIYVAVDGQYAGHIIVTDELKEDARDAIKKLENSGIRKTAILTGDSSSAADTTASELGIGRVYSELLPDQKVEKLEQIMDKSASKGKVVFVGDGINDAPVLARADIGIAMGGLGSDAAIEAADIVLMTDEPSKLADAIKIAGKTRSVVWQNIIFSLGIKGIILALGAMGEATMWEAVFADVGVTFIAVLNSIRAMKIKL